MLNIIRSDIYRLRKGRTIVSTLVGLLLLVLLLGAVYLIFSSESVTYLLENSSIHIAEFGQELDQLQNQIPVNGAAFTKSVLADNMLSLFILPFIIAIFCADFSFGTHRNTLSYESSRKKIYGGKLILSVLAILLLNVFTILASFIIGGIFLGFQGLTATAVTEILVLILLLLPTQLAVICFGYCVAAFTKKSSSVIAIYLITLFSITVIIQLLSLLPPFQWLMYLDWNSVGKILVQAPSLTVINLLLAVGFPLIVAAVTGLLGLSRYCSSEMS